MGSISMSGAPEYAIKCWVSSNTLYFELSGVNGPHIVSFARHELAKALAILFTKFETEGHGPQQFTQVLSKTLGPDGISEDQRAIARAALRKAGII